MKTIFYSTQAKFKLTDEEFDGFIKQINQGKKQIWVSRLKVFLSDKFIWAGEEPEDPNRRKLKDGTIVYRKFGTWYCEKSNAKIDTSYYPELNKDIDDPKPQEKKITSGGFKHLIE